MTLHKYFRFSLYAIVLFTSTISFALHTCAPNSNPQICRIEQSYYAWCQNIGTAKGDASKIVKFYAPGAILLPTVSSKILVNKHGGLDSYFHKLTSYPDIQCHPQKLITNIHKGLAFNSGFYSFSFVKDGKAQTLPARFSFVYKKHGNQWLIIKHHSSTLP
jgi:hypothetical protein